MGGMTVVRGFSLIELLVVLVILSVVSAVGVVAFTSYIGKVRQTALATQFEEVATLVEDQISFLNKGVTSALIVPGTNTPIDLESTCAEFLYALKQQFWHLRDPIDGSPLMTLSTEDRSRQKAGKIRITCYKVLFGTYDNGARCKMRDAAIRVDTYHADCGGACGRSNCIYPNAKCLLDKSAGHSNPTWFRAHESNKIYGKLQGLETGGGVGWRSGAMDCGLGQLGVRRIPKEPDY